MTVLTITDSPSCPVFSAAQPGQFTYLVFARFIHKMKIGKAKNPASRLSRLQTGSPVPLEMVEFTPAISEKVFHADKRLQVLHSHGEWYDFNEFFVEVFEKIVNEHSPWCDFAYVDWDKY